MKTKVLLFGSDGMLGHAVNNYFSSQDDTVVYTADRANAEYSFDFLDDEAVKKCIESVKPDVIINCAAIVNVGLCESDKGAAYLINARFVHILASICQMYGIYLIHISTDHYYSGDTIKKHTEEDKVDLLNEYARTKYCGEQFALVNKDALVVRTNIVGFRGRKNAPTFIEWAIGAIQSKQQMNLFTDFYTSSIHTVQIAKILYDLVNIKPHGLYNVASADVSSKKEFILKLSEQLFGYYPPYVDASVNTLDCKRADSLGLCISKAEALLGYSMPGLDEVISSIKKEYERIK